MSQLTTRFTIRSLEDTAGWIGRGHVAGLTINHAAKAFGAINVVIRIERGADAVVLVQALTQRRRGAVKDPSPTQIAVLERLTTLGVIDVDCAWSAPTKNNASTGMLGAPRCNSLPP